MKFILRLLVLLVFAVPAWGQTHVFAPLDGNNPFTGVNSFSGPTNLNGGGNFSGLFSGNPTFTGSPSFANVTFTGSVTFSFLTGSVQCLHVNALGVVSGTGSDCNTGGGSQVYPAAGVANSTGSVWATSYQVGTAANDLVQLDGSGHLPTGLGQGTVTNTLGPLVQCEMVWGNGGSDIYSNTSRYDVGCFPGVDASAKWNACNAQVIASGTPGICDATSLGGTQAVSQQMNVGNSSSVAVTFILPSAGRWTSTTAFTGGTSSMIKQFSNTTITGSAPELKMIFQNGSGSGGLQYLYSTGTSGGNCYFQADHFTLYNPTVPTASNINMLVNLGCDGSYWRDMQVLDYQDTVAGVEVLNGACCSANFSNFTSNSNYTGPTPFVVISNSSGTVNGINLHNVSFDHPKAGQPNFSCTDTSSAHSSTIAWSGMNYEEGGNADTTTAFNQIAGCGSVGLGDLEIKAETASSTAAAFTISNAFATAFKVGLLSMVGGGGSFTYPATAMINSFTGNTFSTDTHGHFSNYASGPTGFESLTAALFSTTGNCAVNSVSPAACGSAISGAVVIPTTTATYTINSTAVTSHSRFFFSWITYAEDLPSSPTCVTPAVTSQPTVSASTAGTSFTIATPSTTGQTCLQFWIMN